jgi:hypothetical protein
MKIEHEVLARRGHIHLHSAHATDPTHKGIGYHLRKSSRNGGVKRIAPGVQHSGTHVSGPGLWSND